MSPRTPLLPYAPAGKLQTRGSRFRTANTLDCPQFHKAREHGRWEAYRVAGCGAAGRQASEVTGGEKSRRPTAPPGSSEESGHCAPPPVLYRAAGAPPHAQVFGVRPGGNLSWWLIGWRGFPGPQTGLLGPGDLHILCHLARILAGGAGKSGPAGLMIVRVCHPAPSGVGPRALTWAGGGNTAGVGIYSSGHPLAQEIPHGGQARDGLGRGNQNP